MLRIITFIASALFLLAACTTTQDIDAESRWFQPNEIIQDLRPLRPKNSTDLREMAFTLPIIEVRNEETFDWFYAESEPALTEDTWKLPADGAQGSATIIRLPNHSDGSQQIEVHFHPIPTNNPPKGVSYYSRLKRIDGGWKVLRIWKN